MSNFFSRFGVFALALIILTSAATAARADWDDHRHFHADHPGWHRAHRGPDVYFGMGPGLIVAPVWAPAPVTVYQEPASVTMTCASGQTITVTGTGSFPHLLNRANHICATRYPAYAPVVVEGAPAGSSYCREYQSTINVGGAAQRTYGTACMQPGGVWQIRN